MSAKLKRLSGDILYELAGSIFIAAATYNVALTAEFPLTGFSGIAMIIHRLFDIKLGLIMIVMNIPLVLICYKKIGRSFVLKSLRCMLISSLILDYVAPLFPVYDGSRLLAALLTGVLSGIGYAIIYIRASSTGGMDFVIMLVKSVKPHIKAGTITICLDFLIIISTGIIFKDFDGIIYGLIIDFLMASVIDKVILGMNSGNLALIVTDHGEMACRVIDDVCERGATVIPAKGGYRGDDRDVVMVAGTNKDIYQINRAMRKLDDKSFVIILDSKEVHGEGFHITKVAGEEAAQ